MTTWSAVHEGLEGGGHVAWEAALAPPPAAGERVVLPLFLRLRPGEEGLAAAARALTGDPDLTLDPLEEALLLAEAQAGVADLRAVVHAPRAVLARLAARHELLHAGAPVTLREGPAASPLPPPPAAPPGLPVLAVIDDAVAFLHPRFRARGGGSRIAALWMQARVCAAPDPAGGGVLQDGRVLPRAEIDALIAAGGEERAAYARLNRALHGVTAPVATNRAVSHGTMVLDLAAGAAPGEALAAAPILAVQLPPHALADTSGRRAEGDVARALRWTLAMVRAMAAPGDPVPDLVLTLAVGSLAGPGDETAFLADWMQHELARHARLAPGATVRLVCAYGNARDARLVARAEVRAGRPLQLDWRVLPDDHTSSHLELRAASQLAPGLVVRLVPPVASGLPPLAIDWPAGRAGWRLTGPAGLVAALTATPEPGGETLLLVSVAPTAGPVSAVHAPPGPWRVEVGAAGAAPVRVTARVQRDDTPAGYPRLGRQSWLDHPEAWVWDEDSRGWTAPGPHGPVTREGTAVAYAGAAHPQVVFAGAVRPDPGSDTGWCPATYSGEGVTTLAHEGESRGPDLAAPGDTGTVLRGVPAACGPSGAVARLSGTSAAAPQVARRLAAWFLATPPALRTDEGEWAALLGPGGGGAPLPPAPFSPRIGRGVLVR